MHLFDYLVFYSYLIIILIIGIALRHKKRSESEFFVAERSMGWFPVGISIMVTMMTAVNYAIFPTEIFSHGIYIIISLPMFVIVAFPITRIFIPFFCAKKATSAYEFLEERFDLKVRCLASAIFMLWRIVWMAVALYASGRILSAVTGSDLRLLILIAGAVTVCYTAFGGIRAVIWTDVAQFFVLFGGIIAGLIIADVKTPGGFHDIFATAFDGRLFRPAVPYESKFFSFDPTIRVTFWSGTIGTLVAFLARYGADQVVIQRYFSARSVKDARKGFWWNVVCALVVLTLLAMFGMAVYSHSHHLGLLDDGLKPMAHVSALIRSLPWGGCGLMAAGLLAATMSSVDSGINACSAAWTKDFYHRLISKQTQTPEFHIRYSIAFTLIIGATVIMMAESFVYIFGHHHNIFVMANKVINGMGSPLLAIVVLGMIKRSKVNASGMFWGGIIGTAWSAYTALGLQGLALHYYAVLDFVGTLSACYLMSFATSEYRHFKKTVQQRPDKRGTPKTG
jgi:SSS family transporter